MCRLLGVEGFYLLIKASMNNMWSQATNVEFMCVQSRLTLSPNPTNWTKSVRSEEHTSELQSRETISYAVFCLKKKKKKIYKIASYILYL